MKNNKTIGITLRLWTNDLELKHKDKKRVVCWENGVIDIEASKDKKIPNSSPIPFNSLDDILPAIRQLLRKNKILMVSDNKKPRILNAKKKS